MKSAVVFSAFVCFVNSAPKLRLMPEHLAPPSLLTLPSNATSIRTDISDSFHCEGREYGYYADVENDCQLFHVCLPVTYSDGRNQTFRWSFICPEETVFNQEMFTCTRADEAIDCSESPRFYELNRNFGSDELISEAAEPPAAAVPVTDKHYHSSPSYYHSSPLYHHSTPSHYLEEATAVPEVPQGLGRNLSRRGGNKPDLRKL